MPATFSDVIDSIADTLREVDGPYLARIHNQICSNKVKYVGDSLFEDEEDLASIANLEGLVQAAGYTIRDNGTGSAWYALLPGETEIRDEGGPYDHARATLGEFAGHLKLPKTESEGIINRTVVGVAQASEAAHHQNYVGFFSSKLDLLQEVSDQVIAQTMAFHDLSSEVWDASSLAQKEVLVRECYEPEATTK